MAGDWIKFECATPSKSEVYVLAKALGITSDDAIGKLCRTFIWFDQHTTDGFAEGIDDGFLDAIVQHGGWTEAMRKVGWIIDKTRRNKAGLCMPNFDRHNGKSAKERALTNKRVKRSRRNKTASKSFPEKRESESERREENNHSSSRQENSRNDDSPSTSRAEADRLKSRMKWLEKTQRWWGKGERTANGVPPSGQDQISAQREADRTTAERLFDNWIWPEESVIEGPSRFDQAMEIAKRAGSRANPMAYLQKCVKQTFTQTD